MLAALLLMFGVLAFSTAIPLLAAGLDQKDISPESNPLGFGSFLTGVITLGGLYYAIEADDGQKFQHDAGEALQNISAVAIFLMGCLNFIWEYLSNLNKLVWNVDFLEANPPVWPLILTFAKPKVLVLLISTSVVIALCSIARESLKLTPRAFQRQIGWLTESHVKQARTLNTYCNLLEHKAIREHFKNTKSPKNRRIPYKAQLFFIPVFPVLFGSAIFIGVSYFIKLRALQGGHSPDSNVYWFLIVFIPACTLLEWAIHLYKRRIISISYLTSASTQFLLSSLFAVLSVPFLLICCLIGLASLVSAISFTLIRVCLCYLEVKHLKNVISPARERAEERMHDKTVNEADMDNGPVSGNKLPLDSNHSDDLPEDKTALQPHNACNDHRKANMRSRSRVRRCPLRLDVSSKVALLETLDQLQKDLERQAQALASLRDYKA